MSLSSIAPSASPSTFPAARTGGAHRAAERHDARAAQEAGGGSKVGPRQLHGALTDTLAATAAGASIDLQSDAVRDALGDFTGELFDALRAEGGREVGHGPGRHLQRGHAWGHDRGGALAERIDALAARLGAGSTPPAEPAPIETLSVEATPDGAAQAAVEPVVADAAPALAEVATPPAAASSLETSFAALWQALNSGAGDAAGADLAGFLNALAERLRGGGDDLPPVGSLVDITA